MPRLAGMQRDNAAVPPGTETDPLGSKKNAILILHWLLVIAAAYVMLFSGPRPGPGVELVVALLFACNFVLGRLPERLVAPARFDAILLMVDTALLSAGFYLTDTISSDFYLLYFFVIFLAGTSEKLASVLMGSALASAAYVSLVWSSRGAAALAGNLPLRVFFIFAVALLYGFLVERVRLDRARRQAEYVATLEGVNVRLRELVELKQAFIGAVSHELRTPLNAMLGYIDLVLDGAAGVVKGRMRSYIDQAYRQGLQLTRLIEELLSFAHLSRGRTEVRLVETDVVELMEGIRQTVMPAAAAKGLPVDFVLAPEITRIVTDGPKLAQILFHLVENAVKFTEKGSVQVTVSQRQAVLGSGWQGLVLECTVSDTGPGISAEEQEIIFEEFRQLDGSMARKYGGIGLGLSVCRGLVRLLHGDLTLDSTMAQGSRFTVRLPLEGLSPARGVSAELVTAAAWPEARRMTDQGRTS